LIGEKIDLDLLSLFPQIDARNMGGMERERKLLKVNNGGERERVATRPRMKKGPFIAPSMKYGHYRIFRPDYPASREKICPYTGRWTPINSRGRIIQPKFGRIIRPKSKHQHENGDNFCIQTSFLMILGSLESQQRSL
jgi:hypothetical protein